MPITPVVDDISAVDEKYRELYVKRDDGKFQVEGFEDVSGLKSALQKERTEATNAKKKLADYAGVDLEKVRALEEAERKRAEEKATAEQDWTRLKQQMSELHQAELQSQKTELQKLEAVVDTLLIDNEILALSKEKGLEFEPELIAHKIKERVKTDKSGPVPRAVVIDKDGNPRVGDSQGNPMTIRQLVQELRDVPSLGGAFKGSGASGGGAVNETTPAGPGGVKSRSKMSPAEKAAYITKHGSEKFLELPV